MGMPTKANYALKQRRTSIEDLRELMHGGRGKDIPIVLALPYETCEMLVHYFNQNKFETVQEAFLMFMQHTIHNIPPERFVLNAAMREYIAATLRVISQETGRFTSELYSRVEREVQNKIVDIETRGE